MAWKNFMEIDAILFGEKYGCGWFCQFENFEVGDTKGEAAEIFVELAEHPVLAVDMRDLE
jgi:hypothetical protein